MLFNVFFESEILNVFIFFLSWGIVVVLIIVEVILGICLYYVNVSCEGVIFVFFVIFIYFVVVVCVGVLFLNNFICWVSV